MDCQLCMTYHNAERVQEKVKIGKDKEMIVTNRYCPHRDAIVNEEDDGCEKFSPTKFFWCRGWDSWVSIKVCQHRQKKAYNRTCPCSVGLQAAEIDLRPKKVKQLVIRKPKKMLVKRRKK